MVATACDSVDWNPIGSATAHSQLAGVVAGLVFAGIVVILERQAPARRPAEALTMFLAGFFTFALDGFIFGVVAGERTCTRAWTETMVAAGLMGFGALSLFVGLSWLLYSLDRTRSTPLRVARSTAYVLAVIVVAQLHATARDYLRDVRPAGRYLWIDDVLAGGLLVVLGLIAALAVCARRLPARLRRSTGFTAYITIAYVFVCALSFGLLTAVDTSFWTSGVQPTVFIAATLGSVMLPTLVVLVHLLALPVPDPRPPALPAVTQVPAADHGADRPAPDIDGPGSAGDVSQEPGASVATIDPVTRRPYRSALAGGLALIVLGGSVLAARRRRARAR